MANMKSEIVLRSELRPCNVRICKGSTVRGLFHMLDSKGSAIVELEDGSVMRVDPEYIRFADAANVFVEYDWGAA